MHWDGCEVIADSLRSGNMKRQRLQKWFELVLTRSNRPIKRYEHFHPPAGVPTKLTWEKKNAVEQKKKQNVVLHMEITHNVHDLFFQICLIYSFPTKFYSDVAIIRADLTSPNTQIPPK